MLPSRRLLLLVGGASLLFLISAPAALLADGLLLAVALWDWRRTSAPEVERRAPRRLHLGAEAPVRIRVRNRESRALTLRMVEERAPEVRRLPGTRVGAPEPSGEIVEEGDGATSVEGPSGRVRARARAEGALELRLGSEGEAGLEYDLRAEGRGTPELGSLHLRVLSPLGLTWREHEVALRDGIRVQPGVREVRKHRLLSLRHRLRDAGLRRTRRVGEGRSFESLREYVRGDDPRLIDWKATARRGEVIVRQYEAERSQNVLVAVDAGRLMTETIGEWARIEYALSATLLLADVARGYGDRVGLMVFDERVRTLLPPGRVRLARIADALTTVEPRLVEPNYPLAFTTLGQQLRRRSLVVIFTDVIDARASGALLAQVSQSASRHLPLAVTLRNPALAEAAARRATDEEEAYRRAAAEELVQARTLALATMRRAGALVVDAAPDEAIPAAVNRYMEVKEKGLL